MQELFAPLRALAREAGRAIMEVRARGFHVEYKADHSPLTEADKASQAVLAAGLARLLPEVPVLSEEGRDIPFAERRDWTRFLLVDPLDGTKEFVKELGEFCVCVALLEKGFPLLGVVHAPVPDRSWFGGPGLGAFRQDGDGPARAVAVREPDDSGLVAVASRSHNTPELDAYLAGLPVRERINAGSAIKFCLVAEGAADLYARFGPTMEWDTAAGQAVVEGAGGSVSLHDGRRFFYNKESLLNPGFLVLGRRTPPPSR
jgi:3'(2'), 5'-bisphosphate nucleotidase